MQRSENTFILTNVEIKTLCSVLKDYSNMTKSIIEFEGDFNGTLKTAILKYKEMIDVLED